MIKEFVNLYNTLVNLSRNKSLFSIFTDKDTFSDRILILLFHFAFFLREYKRSNDKEYLQKFFDYFFRQIELSLREIGYGDVSINKKMKDYINIFYSILDKINEHNNPIAPAPCTKVLHSERGFFKDVSPINTACNDTAVGSAIVASLKSNRSGIS